MDRVLHFVLALAVVAVLALLVSSDRKKIRIRYVIQLLVIEVLLAWFFLNSDVGKGFVEGFAGMFDELLKFAAVGTNFVFGGLLNDTVPHQFFLQVLCPIVFISALIGILQHIRVLPVIIRAIGFLLSKINGMGKLESFNAVSSLIWVSPRTLSPTKIFSAKCPATVCTPWRQRRCRPFPCLSSARICKCWSRSMSSQR